MTAVRLTVIVLTIGLGIGGLAVSCRKRMTSPRAADAFAAYNDAVSAEFATVAPFCVPRRLSAAQAQIGADIARNENPSNHDLPGYEPPLAHGRGGVLQARLAGALRSSRYWRAGHTLRVRMLNGTPTLHAEVLLAAATWGRAAGLRFEFSRDARAEIRIRFATARASWSYVGTDALLAPVHQPTMQLGGITPSSSRAFVRALALHEFGHVMGMVDRQTLPDELLRWDSVAIRRALEGDGTGDHDDRMAGFLAYASRSQRDGMWEDSLSVMLLPLPHDFVLARVGRKWRGALSSRDSAMVRGVYLR